MLFCVSAALINVQQIISAFYASTVPRRESRRMKRKAKKKEIEEGSHT
jgi:hypothetical protein